MFESGLRRLRREFGAAIIPIALGVLTLIVGGISWGIFVSDPRHLNTPSPIHENKALWLHTVVYGALRTVSDFAPSVWNVNEGNWGTDVAAILGAAAFYASVFLIAANFLSETIRKIAARYLFDGHVVIIGETTLATRLKEVWRKHERQIVQVIPSSGGRPPRASAQVRSAADVTMLVRFGLVKAGNVVIDLGDDIATLSLASELLVRFRDAASAEPTATRKRGEWVLVVRDQTLLEQFAGNLQALRQRVAAATTERELPLVRYFSPERALVRRFLAGRPLFLGKEPGTGIHALIVGSGAAVDELIKAVFQTSLVAGQPRPRATVLSAMPAAERSAFFTGRPGLLGEVDVAFLDLLALDDFEPAVRLPPGHPALAGLDTALRDRDASHPVTEIFLMSRGADENTRLAVKLKQVRAKTGRLRGDLFGCEAQIADEAKLATTSAAFGRTIEGYETFGLDDRFLEDEFCRSTIRQTLAFALHENYRRSSSDPVPPWDGLSETLRRANHNAADHALAKLHMLGFDVTTVPPGAIPRLGDADNRALRDALQARPLSGEVRDIVFLEHDRWSLERRFDGWIFGTKRDNPKLIHHLLVPWTDLSQADQDKDRDQVEALRQCLQDHGDGAMILKRRAVAEVPPAP